MISIASVNVKIWMKVDNDGILDFKRATVQQKWDARTQRKRLKNELPHVNKIKTRKI